ncbi:TRAF3-interacting protein 1 [Leptopilina boulardi]|uniref:TRAF3-interacting protein 1 n=1 Tax=Leptopilina boulardi TaxID=63433 RepID=UPI0021F5D4AE|nr:TRAF3-interacting protein 1 [Leptopilina boulardi]
MSDEVKPEVIKKTQDLLGKYFKKPPLTEKLLKKPPFRFIQDIVAAVIKETGFLEGLFINEELSANISKDKEAKLAFLTKLIDIIKLITGLNLTVRATKIISGHEPTKTNELLQAIGKALDKKISSKEAILHYKNRNEKQDGKNSLKKERNVKKSITGTSSSVNQKNVKKDIRENDGRKLKKSKPQEEKIDEKKVKSKDKIETSSQKVSKIEQNLNQTPLEKTSDVVINPPSEKIPTEKPIDVPISRPPSVKESQDIKNPTNEDIKPQIVRQKSIILNTENVIDKDLPKILDTLNNTQSNEEKDGENYMEAQKKNENKINLPTRESTFSAKSRNWIDAGSNPINTFNIIVENQEKEEEAENDMVVVETNKENLFKSYQDNDNNNVTEDHGYLVAQILKTEQELVNTNNIDPINKKVEIVWQTGVLKERESAVKAVGNLRNLIQTLIKYTNPLGKVLDYLQGDMEITLKELMDYRKQYASVNELLEEERMQTEKFMNHMEESLNDIKMHVFNEQNKIHQIKINISKNEHQIQRLLNDSA